MRAFTFLDFSPLAYPLFCISYPVYLIPAHLSFRSLKGSIEGLWTLRYFVMLHYMKAYTAWYLISAHFSDGTYVYILLGDTHSFYLNVPLIPFLVFGYLMIVTYHLFLFIFPVYFLSSYLFLYRLLLSLVLGMNRGIVQIIIKVDFQDSMCGLPI